MRLKLLHSFLAFIIVNSLFGQSDSIYQNNDTLKNQVSFEFFGSGVKYSIGYERFIIDNPKFNLASRIGIGFFPFNEDMFSIPLDVTTFWGSENSYVETGLGLTWCRYRPRLSYVGGVFPAASDDLYFSDTKESHILYSFRFGFRYLKPNHRSTFRLNLTVLFESSEGVLMIYYPQIPVGISYGYRF